MNPKKWAVWLAVLLCVGVVSFPVSAQETTEKKVVQMRTRSVTPLTIKFGPPLLNKISGRVVGPNVERALHGGQAESVIFVVSDRNNAEVSRMTIPWDESFSDETGITVPFEFDATRSNVAGKTLLRAEVLDAHNKLLALATGSGTILKRESQPYVSDLEIQRSGDQVTGTFSFRNSAKSQKARWFAQWREHSATGPVVGTAQGDLKTFSSRAKQTISFEIPLPERPESYLLEISMRNDKDTPLTGSLRSRVVREGDFAEITAFGVTPNRFLEMGEPVTFSLSGIAREEGVPVTLHIAVDQKLKGKVTKTIDETTTLALKYDEFSHEFSFPVSTEVSEFTIRAQLKRGDSIIEEKTYNTATYKKPSFLGSIEEFFTPQAETESKNFEIWMVTMLTIVLLVFLLGALHRKKKTYLILLAPLLWMGTAHAEAEHEWLLPDDDSSYSPNSTEGFQIMEFGGLMYDNVTFEGLLGGDITEVRVDFTQGEESASAQIDPATVEIMSFQMVENNWYLFSLDLAESNVFDAIENPSGVWEVQVAFVVDDTEYVSDWDGTIIIDAEPPTLSFSVPDEATNTTIDVSVTCTDAGAGCLDDTYTFQVRGNFCDDAEECDNTAPRGFEICDSIGNCTDPDLPENQLVVTIFDPYPPRVGGDIRLVRYNNNAVWRDGQGNFEDNRMETHEQFIFEVADITDEPTPEMEAFYADQFDSNACGMENGDNETYRAPRVLLTWVTASEGEDLEGFEIERIRDGDDPDNNANWIPIGYREAHGDGVPYTFLADTVTDADDFSFRVRISLNDGFFSPAVHIGTPLGENAVIGEDPLSAEISSFTAAEAPDEARCRQKEVLCAGDDFFTNRFISPFQVCCTSQSGGGLFDNESYEFPLEIPFTLSTPPFGEFPMEVPFFLGE